MSCPPDAFDVSGRERVPTLDLERLPELVRLSWDVVDVVSWRHRAHHVRQQTALGGLLSADEWRRAREFRRDSDRRAFLVARGRLRQLLGGLTRRAPAAVRIAAAPSGKPRLADESVGRLRFNVAHSEDLVLCALTLDNEVGVDVERVREETDCDGIARRFFAPREARGLASLEPTARREAFFACWTRKEAIVKATGEGLRRALDSFVVSLDLDRAELLWAEPSLGPVSGWSLISLPLPATHRGAVAVRSSGVALRQWHWPEE